MGRRGDVYVLLFVGPVMLAALDMLLIDRHFDGVFYDAGEGGSPILWQHLSWIFFTGAYVVMLLPGAARSRRSCPCSRGKPAFGHRAVAGALIAIARRSALLAWMQNMFTAPIPIGFEIAAMAAALALTVPFGLLFFNWIATLWGGALQHPRAAAVRARGDQHDRDSGSRASSPSRSSPSPGSSSGHDRGDDGHALRAVGGSIFGGFAALYYWFPKISGRMMGEGMARLSFC